MIILTAYRARLLAVPAVVLRAPHGVHMGVVPQNQPRPHILLEMPEQGGDYTHSGPVGLYDGHLRVSCRADTFLAATELGDQVVLALQNWTGTYHGCAVQMTEHFNTMADYDNTAKVFRHISEYTAFYTRGTP